VEFRHELTYDAPPAAIFEMLADPAFRAGMEAEHGVGVAYLQGNR
jgi:hypothetical protein